jgi:hypothetical protein
VVNAYDKIYVGYKVITGWVIRVLKWKWKWLMKHFDFTKSKYGHLSCAITILTNFLSRHWMDFIYEVLGNQIKDLDDYGWDGNY